jgi:hypothetical protein
LCPQERLSVVAEEAEPPQVRAWLPEPLLARFHSPQETLLSYCLPQRLAQLAGWEQVHWLALPQAALLLPALGPMTSCIRKRPVLPTTMRRSETVFDDS